MRFWHYLSEGWQWLLEMAAQVSGVSNPPLATALLILAIALGIGKLLRWISVWRKSRAAIGKPALEPSHLIIIGVIGTWLTMTVAMAGVVWQYSKPAIEPDDLKSLRDDFDKYIKPRRLTADQITAISEFLLKRPAQEITIYWDSLDQEAGQYASDIYQALHQGGWDVKMNAVQDGKLPEGRPVGIGATYQVQMGSASKGGNPKAIDLLQQAAQATRINLFNGGGSTGPGSATKPEDTVMILVGKRPYMIVDPTVAMEQELRTQIENAKKR
jgi:hypothetical protein